MKHVIRAIALVLTVAMLSVTAFATVAGPAMPSVEKRQVPMIVPARDAAGNPIIEFKLKTDLGNITKTASFSDLVQIALGDIDEADEEVQEKMTKAFESILNAENLTKLNPDLAKQAADLGMVTPAEELVVTELFYLGLPEELEKELAKGDSVLSLIFQVWVNLAANEHLIVMVMNDAGEWILVPNENVKYANGRVEVLFDFVGPVAFIVG